MITLKDVAKEAGVSTATVSRVINNKGLISSQTVELVYQAVEKLGYEPNVLARNLRMKETSTILILVPNITNPYYAHIISGISDTTRKLGFSSFICNTNGERQQEKEILNMLAKRRADGAILLATELGAEWLRKYSEKYPIVQCSEYDPNIDIPHVTIDNYKAAREVVKYLISLGHRRIGMISSENKYLSTQLRLKGYKDELIAAGVNPLDDYVYYASQDYTFQSGKKGAQVLLSQENRPTALFCISDILAQGAITGANEMGFHVPGDVAVIGFDDVEQTTIYRPNITTVAQPCYEIGQRSAELLYQHIRQMQEGSFDASLQTKAVILPHRLIVRDSSCKRDDFLDLSVCY